MFSKSPLGQKLASATHNRTTNLDAVVEHFQSGLSFQRQGLLEEAARQFLRVIELDGCSASAYFNMGAICFQQCRYEEAIRHYKAGLNLAPQPRCSSLLAQHASVHADLGKTYEMLGKWDEALYHLNKALDLNPTHEAAQRRKRRVLEEKNKYEMFLKQAKLAIESIPTSDNINAAVTERFVVKFDEGAPEEFRTPICRLLEQIYTELGGKFDYYPQQNLKIFVLNASQKERSQLSLPRWAAGRYVRRVPMESQFVPTKSGDSFGDGSIAIARTDDFVLRWRTRESSDLSLLYVVLRHEYVHLLVNTLTNGQCPMWLNEGLAGYYARGLLNSERETLLQVVKQNRYIPLKHLERSFSHLSKGQIRLAYIESCSVVEFMMETYGMTKIKKLLHSLGMGKSFGESLIYSLSAAKKRRFTVNSKKRHTFVATSQKKLETQWLTWVMDCYK